MPSGALSCAESPRHDLNVRLLLYREASSPLDYGESHCTALETGTLWWNWPQPGFPTAGVRTFHPRRRASTVVPSAWCNEVFPPLDGLRKPPRAARRADRRRMFPIWFHRHRRRESDLNARARVGTTVPARPLGQARGIPPTGETASRTSGKQALLDRVSPRRDLRSRTAFGTRTRVPVCFARCIRYNCQFGNWHPLTPCLGVEPRTRRRGWRSKPVRSPILRHGALGRQGS
jgi:hypothetical protein